jgi:SAM-dependent methyltransferase
VTHPYQVTAEFYDLLQATHYVRVAQRLLGRWLGEPKVGIVDAGAGTGLVTAMLARQCEVTVHAIEPAAGMRAIMLSRLAGRPDELAKVRVHAHGIEELGLTEVADFAWCFNTLASLDSAARAAALAALAKAMVRGGTLVLQRPPARTGRRRRDLPRWELGGDIYSGEVTCTQVGIDSVQWHFVYRVSRDDTLFREASETFTGYLATEAEVDCQLDEAGFIIAGADEPEVVVARRKA